MSTAEAEPAPPLTLPERCRAIALWLKGPGWVQATFTASDILHHAADEIDVLRAERDALRESCQRQENRIVELTEEAISAQ